jgi:hypothetical protein
MDHDGRGRADRITAAGIVLVVCAFIGLTTHYAATAINNYVLLADAWLHGRVWIVFPGAWIDAVPYGSHAYIVEAPVPAVLLLPLVAIFGTAANQNVLAALLAGVAAATMYGFARSVGDARVDALLVAVFLLFGTSVMYGAMSGDVWLVAHLSALTFTLLALLELNTKRRLWVVMLFGLAAALSRYPLAPALPVYAWLLRDQLRQRKALAAAAAVVLPVLALWCTYNWSRWHTLYDPGFAIWHRIMDPRAKSASSAFSLTNLGPQVKQIFFEPPKRLPVFPWLAPRPFGTGLAFVSTGLAVAFGVRLRDRLVLPLIVLAVLAAVPALLYYDGGGVQFGNRHALDFEPFLLALVAISLRHEHRWWKRLLLAGSAAFAAYLLFVWRAVPGAVS